MMKGAIPYCLCMVRKSMGACGTCVVKRTGDRRGGHSSMSAQSRDDVALAAPDAARASGASTGRARRTGARGAPPVPKLKFGNGRKFYTESAPAKSQILTVRSPEAVAR